MEYKTRLIDIALSLGISVTTVSRALNNKSDISQKTKEAVLAKVEEMNYKPNTLAVSLRKNKNYNIIGVVIPSVDHYFFSTVLKGIMDKAQQNNFLVMVGESSHDPSKEKIIFDELADYCTSGILLTPCRNSKYSDVMKSLEMQRLPVVLIDRTFDGHDCHYVQSDDFNGAVLAVNHLIQQGYKNIGHFKGSDNWSIGNDRYKGFIQAMKENNMPINSNFIKTSSLATFDEGYALCKELFSSDVTPDAIFTVTDDVAFGVYEYAKEHHIRIPEDLGVVGFSNAEVSRLISPKLTTIQQRGQDMGEIAFDFLQRIPKEKGKLLQKTFESKLIIRESSIRPKT